MTKDEALTLALETLEISLVFVMSHEMIKQPEGADWYDNRITAIKEALAQSKFDPWRAALVQPDHIRDATKMMAQPEERNFCPRCGKRTADLTTVHTCTPPIAADPKAFYGFPSGSVSTPNAGGKCVTAGETAPTHTINSTNTVAVATDTYWLPIDKDTPRSVKLQLLSIGGVAQYGTLQSDTSFYTHWCPVPKKPK